MFIYHMLFIVYMVLYFASLDSLNYCFGFTPPPTLHIQSHILFSFQICILCQNSLTRELKIRVERFIPKKLFTHFEMLIVSTCPELCKVNRKAMISNQYNLIPHPTLNVNRERRIHTAVSQTDGHSATLTKNCSNTYFTCFLF